MDLVCGKWYLDFSKLTVHWKNDIDIAQMKSSSNFFAVIMFLFPNIDGGPNFIYHYWLWSYDKFHLFKKSVY